MTDRAGLRLDIDGAVATVTLQRPERRNAMTPGMWRGLAAIGAELPPPVRVVVVRGEGPSFSAGIDLRLFSADGVPGEDPLVDPRSPGFADWLARLQAGFLWLHRPEHRLGGRRPRARPGRGSSWPWRATCGCWPTTRSCA